jgi:hypothetical protein
MRHAGDVIAVRARTRGPGGGLPGLRDRDARMEALYPLT